MRLLAHQMHLLVHISATIVADSARMFHMLGALAKYLKT